MEGDEGATPPRRTLGGVQKPKFKPRPKARKKKSPSAKPASASPKVEPEAKAAAEQQSRPRRSRPDLVALSGEVAFAGGQSGLGNTQGRTLLSTPAPSGKPSASATARPSSSSAEPKPAPSRAAAEPSTSGDGSGDTEMEGEAFHIAAEDREWPPPLVSTRPPVTLPFSGTNRQRKSLTAFGNTGAPFILQLPNRLPLAMRNSKSSQGTEAGESSPAENKQQDEAKEDQLTKQDLDDLNAIHAGSRKRYEGLMSVPQGVVGKLRVHQSGKRVLEIGGAEYIVKEATPSQHYQEIVSINRDSKVYVTLGPAKAQYVASPDITSLLSQWALKKKGIE